MPEARSALEDALEINANPSSAWWASYEITTQAPLGLIGNSLSHKTDGESELVGAIAVNDMGEYFAVSDSAGNISTYETLTGKKLADCVMPDQATLPASGLHAHSMAATENHLVVSSANGNGDTLACFDARTGNLVWSFPNTGTPSFNTTYGADLLSMAFPLAAGGYEAMIMDLASSKMSSTTVDGAEAVDTSTPYFNTPGARFGTNYAAFGNQLFSAELDGSAHDHVELAYANVTSLAYLNGLVVAASADPMPADDVVRRYAIEAFDENLALVWRQDGSFTSEMIVNNEVTSLVTGEPAIHQAAIDESKVAISVGRQVLVLDSSDGTPITTLTFDQSVVDAHLTNSVSNDASFLTITCSNGTVNCIDPLDPQNVSNDARRLALPFPVRWAHATSCGHYDAIVAIPADADNRIVSYRTDWSRGEQTGDQYSLSELRTLAERVLADGGRTG